LTVALQNSQHRFDGDCPWFTPDDAQSLLLGYAEQARSENPSPGNSLLWCCTSFVFSAFRKGAVICCHLDLDVSGMTAKKNAINPEQVLPCPQFELPTA